MISDGILTVPRLPARFPGGVFYADDALERLKVINQATRDGGRYGRTPKRRLRLPARRLAKHGSRRAARIWRRSIE